MVLKRLILRCCGPDRASLWFLVKAELCTDVTYLKLLYPGSTPQQKLRSAIASDLPGRRRRIRRSAAMGGMAQKTTDHTIEILNSRGQGDYIGEPISQLAHSLQAAHLAAASHASDEVVLAALLHDIGQFLPAEDVGRIAGEVKTMNSTEDSSAGGVGRVGHEMIGEKYLLNLGYSEKVAALVGSHVAAKRYLCAIDPNYYDALSDASKKSLAFQGGPMKGAELEGWANHPWSSDMCQLRRWDDAAKVVGLDVPPAETYRDMLFAHLSEG